MTPAATRNPVMRLLALVARERSWIAAATLSVAALSVAQLYLTWIVKEWVEGPVLARDMSRVATLFATAAGAAAIAMLSLLVSRYTLAYLNQRMIEAARDAAWEAVLRAPVAVVRGRSSGEWLSRLFNDVNVLSGFLTIVCRRLLAESVLLAGAIVMMFVLSWRLALAMAVVVPLTGWLLVTVGTRIRRWSRDSQEASASLTATINEQLGGFTTVRGLQGEATMLARTRGDAALLRERVLRGELWSAALIALVFLVSGTGLFAIIAWGTFTGLGGIPHATFLAFCLYAGQTVEPARRLSEVHGLLQQSLAAATRVFEVVDLTPVEDLGTCSVDSGAVDIERLTFGYEGSPLLHDVSLRIDEGEMVAVVGPSGSGKTTLARLLARYENAPGGSVRIGTHAIEDVRLRDLRSSILLVEQEPFVFSGTIAANLRLARGAASDSELREALEVAGLASFALDDVVREAGRDLSGGERQRLALARTIVRDPRILLLDEATSSIDSETEAAIFERLDPWLRQRTVVAISHRLATVVRFPRVVVLSGGRIVADGTPQDLIAGSAPFRALFADQFEQLHPARTLAAAT